MPDKIPKRMNATTIDSSVNIVRAGLRHSPAQMSGTYFT